jgi:tRNA uridine 5-carbamoylmethylation protein Kti12
MPLIIVAGYPCVGKTVFSHKLMSFLQKRDFEVVMFNEETLCIDKMVGYQDSTHEKETRSALKSAVERALTSQACIIVDSLNYIKGYRYELYCVARAHKTPHCIAWVTSENDLSELWHKQLTASNQNCHSESNFHELRRRFEAPLASNRWDNPLFRFKQTGQDTKLNLSPGKSEERRKEGENLKTISASPDTGANTHLFASFKNSTGKSTSFSKKNKKKNATNTAPMLRPDEAFQAVKQLAPLSISGVEMSDTDATQDGCEWDQDIDIVFEKILVHLNNPVEIQSNPSTTVPVHAQADLLHDLDRVSAHITRAIITHQNCGQAGVSTVFSEYDRAVILHRFVSPEELQRHRRQFVRTHSLCPPSAGFNIGSVFIDYLLDQLAN